MCLGPEWYGKSGVGGYYYAFGMEMEGEWTEGNDTGTEGGSNRFKYNGKELNEELGLYDYGARWYDPATARWLQVDPLAETMSSWSPYNYTFNNPIKYTDPDGRNPIIGFIVGAGLDLAIQVGSEYASGKTLKQSFRSIDSMVRTESGGSFAQFLDLG